MPCPVYVGDRRPRCGAVADSVTPTLHEREHFCESDEHARCPTLRSMLCLGRQLDEREYLANWLPPAPGR